MINPGKIYLSPTKHPGLTVSAAQRLKEVSLDKKTFFGILCGFLIYPLLSSANGESKAICTPPASPPAQQAEQTAAVCIAAMQKLDSPGVAPQKEAENLAEAYEDSITQRQGLPFPRAAHELLVTYFSKLMPLLMKEKQTCLKSDPTRQTSPADAQACEFNVPKIEGFKTIEAYLPKEFFVTSSGNEGTLYLGVRNLHLEEDESEESQDSPTYLLGAGTVKKVKMALDVQKAKQKLPRPNVAWQIMPLSSQDHETVQGEIQELEKEFEIQKRLSTIEGVVPPPTLFMKTQPGKKLPDALIGVQEGYGGDLSQVFGTPHSAPLVPLASQDKVIPEVGYEFLKQLAAIHAKKVFHKDLKPKNIFIQTAVGKISVHIGDFGWSEDLSHLKPNTPIDPTAHFGGTPNFLDPQFMPPHADQHSFKNIDDLLKMDLWSAALILYYLEVKEGRAKTSEGCLHEDLSVEAIIKQISKIKTYDQICTQCKLFCDPKDPKKSLPPEKDPRLQQDSAKRNRLQVIYQMLNLDLKQRPTAFCAMKMWKDPAGIPAECKAPVQPVLESLSPRH